MADENVPTHYRVTVKEAFVAANQLFRPGDRYTVTKELYDSDGFKDHCATAQPLSQRSFAPALQSTPTLKGKRR